MRPWLVPAVAFLAITAAAPASAQTGGTAAPEERERIPPPDPPRGSQLVATEFSATPAPLAPGAPVEFAYRVDARVRRVRLRIDLVPADGGRRAARIRLGWKPTGVRQLRRWTLEPGTLPAGAYVARLHAADRRGHQLLRTASASGRSALTVAGAAPVQVVSGSFPVQGEWSYGGEGSGFGADRGTHAHQGQDISAPRGTPVVTPRAGYVRWRAFQKDGAGHYLVVRGDDGRDYVFMHLQSGSIALAKEDPVTADQPIGAVGSSGRSSGAHLHFEIWPCGWYVKGCSPIDPRPDLDAWSGAAAPVAGGQPAV